jgi:hypothetical protein
MILGVSMIAVCEGFMLGKRLGLDAQKLFNVVSTASGSCWSLVNYCPVPGPVPTSPANRDYQAGFTAAMPRRLREPSRSSKRWARRSSIVAMPEQGRRRRSATT